jgi:hypothetical protein
MLLLLMMKLLNLVLLLLVVLMPPAMLLLLLLVVVGMRMEVRVHTRALHTLPKLLCRHPGGCGYMQAFPAYWAGEVIAAGLLQPGA